MKATEQKIGKYKKLVAIARATGPEEERGERKAKRLMRLMLN